MFLLQLSISKYLCRVDNQPVRFSEVLTREGRPAGRIEGVVTFTNVPKYAQFVGMSISHSHYTITHTTTEHPQS
jgi:hypothetical protein